MAAGLVASVGVGLTSLVAVGTVDLATAPAAAAAGTWSQETIAGMDVRLYTPSSAPARSGGRALMIGLHGCVQKNTDMQTAGNWARTADEFGMVVALPEAPGGGVIAGCWDYYGTGHSSSAPSRHDDNLIALANQLKSRTSLGIDSRQVYLSGLSSGGGETMVMGCLAPQIFAGIGINAGPTVGTESSQIGSVQTTRSAATATCNNFAGSNKAAFATQLTSVVYGSNDTTVAPGYDVLNAQVMAGIYGAGSTSAIDMGALPGANTSGQGTVYSDATGPRVSIIDNSGLGHAWPAGAPPGGLYINANSVDYPAYVTDFFFTNNRRAGSGTPTSSPTTSPTSPTSPPTTPPTTPPTSPPTTPAATCWTATNLAHKQAGRAISYGNNPYNPYYAVGSQDYLGQGDSTVTSLRRVSASRVEKVASCPRS